MSIRKIILGIMKLLKNTPSFYDFAQRIYRFVIAPGEGCALVYHCRDYTSNRYIRLLLKILATPYCLLKYFHVREVKGREGLALVLIAKNEAPYIEEWLNFHVKQGVSHFIIYDNESMDNFYEVLKPYINSGLVTYHVIKGKVRQVDAYNIAIANYGDKFKYMGFIDADEFMFIRKNTVMGGGMIFTNSLMLS